MYRHAGEWQCFVSPSRDPTMTFRGNPVRIMMRERVDPNELGNAVNDLSNSVEEIVGNLYKLFKAVQRRFKIRR